MKTTKRTAADRWVDAARRVESGEVRATLMPAYAMLYAQPLGSHTKDLTVLAEMYGDERNGYGFPDGRVRFETPDEVVLALCFAAQWVRGRS